MSRVVKIAISMPEDLFEAAERERVTRHATRSELFRLAMEELLRRQREQEAVACYLRGYREDPESDEDVQLATALASTALAREPWE